jgi:hypothetical protein
MTMIACAYDLVAPRARARVADVAGHRVVEQCGILRHDTDRAAHAGGAAVADVLAVDEDAPRSGS